MKKLYSIYCKAEEVIVMSFLSIIVVSVFLSAILRTIKMPINWANDLALLLFSWLVFLGADIAIRNTELVKIDMLLSKFPKKFQLYLSVFWSFLIIIFLCYMIHYGVLLALDNSRRLFQSLGISYSWATISLPVGSVMIILTLVLKTYKKLTEKDSEEAT